MTLTQLRRSPANNAFTLIELLVVIAIIAILAAILFPVFAQARAKARQSSCLSNQKQIGTAILSYNQDFDDAYPMAIYYPAGGTGSGSSTWLSWPAIIQPYLKNTQVLICPSETQTLGPVPGTFTPAYPNGISVNYLYNFYLGGNSDNLTAGTFTNNLPNVKSPATVVMLVDGGSNPQSSVNQSPTDPTTWKENIGGKPAGPNTLISNNHGPYLLLNSGSATLPDATYVDYGGPLARHNGMSNVLWADGHAKAARIESFYKLYGTGEVANKPTDTARDPVLWAANWSPCLDPYYGCNYTNP